MRNTLIAALLMAGSAATPVGAREVAVATAVVEQIRSHADGTALWWMGNAGWLIKWDGTLIGIDLDLGSATDALPAGIASFEQPSGLYRRRFEHGVVLVNPTGSDITVSVATVAGAGSWDLAGFSGGGAIPADADVSGMSITRTPVTDVTVDANDAAILLER